MTAQDKDQDSQRAEPGAEHEQAGPKGTGPRGAEAIADIGAVFKGLGGFVEMLGALVEKAEQVERQGEFKVKGLGDEARGVYGFSVRTGLGGVPQVSRFGNINRTPKGPVVEDVREPLVDVFDEPDAVIITAELPGVAEEEISLALEGNRLSLSTTGRYRYAKEITLPSNIAPDSLERSHRNGIFQVKVRKV